MASQSSPTVKARTEGFVLVNRVIMSVPPDPIEKPSELNRYSLSPRSVFDNFNLSYLPITRAGSTGRCNTGLEFTRRRLKAQSLSRALIEAQSYLVEIGLSVTGQVGVLREVLS